VKSGQEELRRLLHYLFESVYREPKLQLLKKNSTATLRRVINLAALAKIGYAASAGNCSGWQICLYEALLKPLNDASCTYLDLKIQITTFGVLDMIIVRVAPPLVVSIQLWHSHFFA